MNKQTKEISRIWMRWTYFHHLLGVIWSRIAKDVVQRSMVSIHSVSEITSIGVPMYYQIVFCVYMFPMKLSSNRPDLWVTQLHEWGRWIDSRHFDGGSDLLRGVLNLTIWKGFLLSYSWSLSSFLEESIVMSLLLQVSYDIMICGFSSDWLNSRYFCNYCFSAIFSTLFSHFYF